MLVIFTENKKDNNLITELFSNSHITHLSYNHFICILDSSIDQISTYELLLIDIPITVNIVFAEATTPKELITLFLKHSPKIPKTNQLLSLNNLIRENLLRFDHTTQNEIADLYIHYLNDDLLHTARVYCDENMHNLTAAKSLFIHRNTLSKRLEKIHYLTGLNLHTFYDCALLNMILTLKNKT